MDLLLCLGLVALAFIQTMSFTLVSRARNRDNTIYHIICSIFSNGVWFVTFGVLVKNDMSFYLFLPYLVGTVTGSLFGAKVAMWVELKIGAKT